MRLWVEKNDVEMYSTHNGGKYFVAERFIRTLKKKNCKYFTSISKFVYIDKLDDIVNNYNSSNTTGVIKTVLNSFFFTNRFRTHQKEQKAPKSTKKHQTHKEAQKCNQAKAQKRK